MRTIRPRYAVFGVAVVAVLAATILGTTSLSRPNACARCHGQLVRATQRSAHASVDCYRCHADTGALGQATRVSHEVTSMYPRAMLRAGLTRPARQTSADRCLECHANVLEEVVSGTRLRIDHRRCAKAPTCDGCHSTTAHGDATRWKSAPAMEQCVSCHAKRGAPVTCTTCHLEDATKTEHVKGAWQVTHGPNWRATHGMGNIASCRTCHPEGYCARCHGIDLPHPSTFGQSHGEDAKRDPKSCTTCHPNRAICNECHGMEMPHPEGFLKQHTTVATSSSDKRCMICHIDGDCQNCHDYHTHPGGAKGLPEPWPLTNESLRPEGGN